MPDVSIVIPTHNRASTLEKTLPSYISQDCIGEIIIVDDASNDNTESLTQSFKKTSPIPIKYVKNKKQKGAAGSRNTAIEYISMPFVAWGEDDLFYETGYIKKLLNILKEYNADIVGGRLIYMLPGENCESAFKRTNIIKNTRIINLELLELDCMSLPPSSVPVSVPFLHSAILTRKTWLDKIKYDENYGGNGYREETDFQVNVFKNGGRILFCPNTCCFHLSRSDINKGGQHERNKFNYEYWVIKNNNYFLDKYYTVMKEKTDLNISKAKMKRLFLKERILHCLLPYFINKGYALIEKIKRIIRKFL